MFYPAIATPDDGAYVVTFPDAPGCVTQVDSVEQVMPMATEELAGGWKRRWMSVTRLRRRGSPSGRRVGRAGCWTR